MTLIDILLTSIGLSMDAFAVAVCKGLSMKNNNLKKGIVIGFYFGIFQGLMPIIGYILGISFQEIVFSIDHWVAFTLLSAIGGNMIKESLSKETQYSNDKVDCKTMIPLAIATSIDALAIGITFAFLKVNIIKSVIFITVTTFIMSFIGAKIGRKFGLKYEKKAELIGGIILILIGTKILLEHLNFL